MRKILIISLLLPLLCAKVKAQNPFEYDEYQHQKSLRLNVGTQGAGAEFSYGVLPSTALRLGVNIIPVSANNVIAISGFNSTSKLDANFSNIHLLADVTPFKSAPAFRLVAGAGYFMRANGGVEVLPSDRYTYGDIVLTPDQVGKLNMNVNWKGVAPYFGFGLLKALPAHRFNINIDLGTYYLRQPSAQIIGTGLLTGNESQVDQLRSNVKSYRFLPVAQLNFNFKL